jgi:DNA-3-methyladenine glycosylase II
VNRVDLWEGRHLRLLEVDGELALVATEQRGRSVELSALAVTSRAIEVRAVSTIRNMLGLDLPPAELDRVAELFPRAAPFARALAGVRPPVFPTLFEAIANVIPFQQVSLDAGAAIVARLVASLGARLDHGGRTFFAFPQAAAVARARLARLRAAGLSRAKALALREAARTCVEGGLDRDALARAPVDEAIARLCELRGIGAWSAGVLLLRGVRRLDVFPTGDAGVARGLGRLLGLPKDWSPDRDRRVAALGPVKGWLYYLALGASLLERGLIDPTTASSR